MLFVSVRKGETAPTVSELRLWAAVWLAVGLAIVVTGIAIALAG